MYSKYSPYVTTVILLAVLGISIACLVLIIQEDDSATTEPISQLSVETTVGTIRGLKADDGDYSMFLGIRYAQVNRSNPFGAAIPINYYEGGFDAYDDSAICPQQEEFNRTIVGNLDCLDLNIYVPNPVSITRKLPVMVYIFGGSYQIGFAGRFLLGPRFLVRHDVILVTINYRLGPYGFLNLDTPEIPGNQGFRDQRLALKWVRQNIQYFGGDPDQITLFGNSAGGSAIEYHLMSNHELLFNKMISQSFSSLGGLLTSGSHHPAQILQLAQHLGQTTSNIDDAVQFLTQLDELSVVKASIDLGLTFTTTVEHNFEGVDTFIRNYSLFLDVPKARDVSVMIGFTDGEMDSAYNSDFSPAALFQAQVSNRFQMDDNELEEMAAVARKFYIGDEDVNSETRFYLCDLIGDLTYAHRIHRTKNKLLENNVKKLYQYYFTYVGNRNFVRDRANFTIGRAMHADEIGYLFDVSYMISREMTAEDQNVIDKITTLWTNFAKFGDPTPTLSSLLPVRWLPVTAEKNYYYTIDSEVSLSSAPVHERIAFWDLFYLLNEEFQREYFDMK